ILRDESISLDRIIALAKSTDQHRVLIEFDQFLFRNPLMTEKQFYLGFIRILLTHQHGEHSVIPYSALCSYRIRGVTGDGLRDLVDLLIALANEKLQKMHTEVRQLVRDVDGKRMVAVVTEMMDARELMKGSPLSELELATLFEWVHSMFVFGNGHIDSADVFAFSKSFGLQDERTREILHFLIKHDYFEKTESGFAISFRGMLELDPVVTGRFRLRLCSRCDRLVVMTQRRLGSVNDEVVHAGCNEKAPSNNNFEMTPYLLRIHGVEKLVQKNRVQRHRRRVKRMKRDNVFDVTSEDEEDFLNEVWSEGEDAQYEQSEIEKICLDDAGLKY
ncbi:hypothetical protein PENTCL1PPCAC_28947, partial [Pristionchus entomophagus]